MSAPITFGPFHRIESPTQSRETSENQQTSQQVWGRPRRHSDIPQVQAYLGPLPEGVRGIEFTTAVAPDKGTVGARWTGPRNGVIIEDGFAKIDCLITRNTQIEEFVEEPELELQAA